MTEDRVKEGKEYRQNIIDKLNVDSSKAKTYKGPDEEKEEKEEKCTDRVKEAKKERQEILDSQ